MRKLALFNFLLLLCFAFAVRAQSDFNLPIPQDPEVKIGKLPNGLTYYIRKNAKPERRVELRLVVKAGSILEREDQRGLAHFVEHMAFNGTEHFEKNELVSFLQSIGIRFGADLNAYTSFDETVYILPIPTERKESLDKGLLVLHDWATGIRFDQTELDKERGVVLEEYRLGRGAGQRLNDQYFPKLFAGSQYAARLPIGKKEILENFKRETILDFYETWYRPDLMAIVAVGDLDPAQMEAKIKAQFSGLKAKRGTPERPEFKVPDTRGTLVEIVTDREAPGAAAQLIYKKPENKIKTPADLRARVARQFYNSLIGTRLAEIRQSPNAPFISASAGFAPLLGDKSAFSMSASTTPQSLKPSIAALLAEVRRAQLFGFTQAELDRLRRSYLTGLDISFRERKNIESDVFASDYVNNFLKGEPLTSVEFDYEFGKRIAPTVTLAEVNALAKQTTTDDNRAIIVTGIAGDDFKYPTEAEILALLKESETAKLEPYTEKISTEPLVKDLPGNAKVVEEKLDAKFGITRWTLSNGVKVVLKPTDFKADQITMYGFSPGGLSLVETEKMPSSLYFNQVVGESGVKNLSRIELAKSLAGKAANASISVDELFENVSGNSTPQDFETMLQLAYLKFTNVNFDKAVFDSVIAKQRMVLPTLTASPQSYFNQQILKVISQNNPRVFDPYDTANLDKAKFADIQTIYKDRFADASDFTFIFVGNFQPDQIKPQIVKYLGNLPSARRAENWKDWKINPPKGPLEKVFKKGVDDRSTVTIYYAGDAVYDRDENRSLTALGELLTIKLIEDLREARSGVYGVGARGSITKNPSGRFAFVINFSAAPQNLDALVAETNAVIAKIQNGEIDEKDIQKVKEARLVGIEQSFKNNSFWLSAIRDNLMNGDELLNLDEAKARINAINKADLQRAARKYLVSENRLQFVLTPETVAASKAAGQTTK